MPALRDGTLAISNAPVKGADKSDFSVCESQHGCHAMPGQRPSPLTGRGESPGFSPANQALHQLPRVHMDLWQSG